jgi:hypothetical protein
MLDVWNQLAERYSRRIDEDDIVDLRTYEIVKDRGVIRGIEGSWEFGRFADADVDAEDKENDRDDIGNVQDSVEEVEDYDEESEDELDMLPKSEVAVLSRRPDERQPDKSDGDESVPTEPAFKPIGAFDPSNEDDARDLQEFLEAEQRRREFCGEEDASSQSSLHPYTESEDETDILGSSLDAQAQSVSTSDDELSIWSAHDRFAIPALPDNAAGPSNLRARAQSTPKQLHTPPQSTSSLSPGRATPRPTPSFRSASMKPSPSFTQNAIAGPSSLSLFKQPAPRRGVSASPTKSSSASSRPFESINRPVNRSPLKPSTSAADVSASSPTANSSPSKGVVLAPAKPTPPTPPRLEVEVVIPRYRDANGRLITTPEKAATTSSVQASPIKSSKKGKEPVRDLPALDELSFNSPKKQTVSSSQNPRSSNPPQRQKLSSTASPQRSVPPFDDEDTDEDPLVSLAFSSPSKTNNDRMAKKSSPAASRPLRRTRSGDSLHNQSDLAPDSGSDSEPLPLPPPSRRSVKPSPREHSLAAGIVASGSGTGPKKAAAATTKKRLNTEVDAGDSSSSDVEIIEPPRRPPTSTSAKLGTRALPTSSSVPAPGLGPPTSTPRTAKRKRAPGDSDEDNPDQSRPSRREWEGQERPQAQARYQQHPTSEDDVKRGKDFISYPTITIS